VTSHLRLRAPAALTLAALLGACAEAPPRPTPKPTPVARSESAESAAARGQRLFDEAVRLREEMERAQAVDWTVLEGRWRAAAEGSPLAEAHYNHGVALEQLGRLGEARSAYQRALSLKPLRQAAVNLGVVLERDGDARGAAAAYTQAIRDFPEDGLARARLAALYRQSGQLDDAWKLAREALLRDAGNLTAYRTMIRVAVARQDLDLAKLVALRAEKVAPKDAEVAYLAGQIAMRQGEPAAAATQWRRALELQPGLVAARVGLLDASVRQERWAEAAEQSLAVLKEDPSSAAVQLVLGVAQRHLGKVAEALRAYDAAEQLGAGKLPEVHLARGILLMRDRSDCAGALRSFEAYERAVGPTLPQGSPAPRLMRECQEQLEQGRQATEAARQLQADAEKKAAEAAAKKAAEAPAAPAPAPAPEPIPAAPPARTPARATHPTPPPTSPPTSTSTKTPHQAPPPPAEEPAPAEPPGDTDGTVSAPEPDAESSAEERGGPGEGAEPAPAR
jgi:tetratricopeptide (TPR) repeat protein